MRLASAPHCDVDVDALGVRFKMDTGTRLITCCVTRDALLSKARRDQMPTRDQTEIFLTHRALRETPWRAFSLRPGFRGLWLVSDSSNP